MHHGPHAWTAIIAGLLAAGVSRAHAQVACTSPDALCTGDPCVVSAVTVTSPCVLDFGARTLELGGTLVVPDGGILDLTAGSVIVRASVGGRGATGPSITLSATGALEQHAKVWSQGDATPGTVTLLAGGDMQLRGNVSVASTGAIASPGGTIWIDAGGTVTGLATKIDARGRTTTPAGQVTIRGAAGVSLPLGTHFDAGGGVGGTFEISSTGGPVFIETDVRARTTTGTGGSFVIASPSGITLNRDIVMDGGAGGSVTVTGDTITTKSQLTATGKQGAGGTVALTGTTSVTILGTVKADGRTAGGTVTITGGAIGITRGRLGARATSGPGGQISLTSTTGNLAFDGTADAKSAGTFVAAAAGDLTAVGRIRVGSVPPGCIAMTAAGTLTLTGSAFDVPVTASCP